MIKRGLLFLTAIWLMACQRPDAGQLVSQSVWIDLTHPFERNTVYWPTNTPFSKDTVAYGYNDKGYFYASFLYMAEEHGGTHFDAPLHFSSTGRTVEQIPLEELMGPGVIIDVSPKALDDRDYLVSTEDFLEWEKRNGVIPEGAIILIHTGYAQFYPDLKAYTGTARTGAEAVPYLRFPGLSPEAALWLVEQRSIHAVGLDTPSIDYGQSQMFESHRILCGNQKTIYENLNNLHLLPEKGSFIIALPMKIKGGSGAPLRIIAMLP